MYLIKFRPYKSAICLCFCENFSFLPLLDTVYKNENCNELNFIGNHNILSGGYIVKFTPHFLHVFKCWKYFDDCFMDKNLPHISLSKFDKLNKKRNRTFLITQFTFALYLAFIFSTFSVYLWRVVWSTLVSVQNVLTRNQKNVLWIVCAE